MKTKIRVTLITDEEEKFYGPGVQELLAGIREHGSVKEACAAMELSYSKGRRILKHAETVLGFALVIRQQGGASGGAANLTPEAEDFMARYQQLTEAVSQYTRDQMQEIYGDMCHCSRQ